MPGMMDTILNLGLNDETVKGLAAKSGNARFAYDSYRRFIQMYSDVVLELEHGAFEETIGALKDERDCRAELVRSRHVGARRVRERQWEQREAAMTIGNLGGRPQGVDLGLGHFRNGGRGFPMQHDQGIRQGVFQQLQRVGTLSPADASCNPLKCRSSRLSLLVPRGLSLQVGR
jgi:phosphoenolpyruvate synthase/pyruvate phosphate dikinase